jgi:hypothetical protein
MTDPASSPDDNLEIIAQLRNELAEKDRLQRALVGIHLNNTIDALNSQRGKEKVSWFRRLFSRFSTPEESKMIRNKGDLPTMDDIDYGWRKGNFDVSVNIDDWLEDRISDIRLIHEQIEATEELLQSEPSSEPSRRDMSNTHFWQGRLHHTLGNYDAAEKEWRKGVRILRDLGEPIDQVFIDRRY